MDQVISMCLSNDLRRKLLEKSQALTLQNLQELARSYEAVKRQTMSMNLAKDPFNRVQEKPFHQGKQDRGKGGKSGGQQTKTGCFRCGKPGHFARELQCPARGKKCSKCHQVGHFACVCKTKAGKTCKYNAKWR